MVLVTIEGKLFQLVDGPGTLPQGTRKLRGAPPWAGAQSETELARAMSEEQLSALVSMANWAESNLQGDTGVTSYQGRQVPSSAATMGRAWKNADFGGKSVQELRQERKEARLDAGEIASEAQDLGKSINANASPPNPQ